MKTIWRISKSNKIYWTSSPVYTSLIIKFYHLSKSRELVKFFQCHWSPLLKIQIEYACSKLQIIHFIWANKLLSEQKYRKLDCLNETDNHHSIIHVQRTYEFDAPIDQLKKIRSFAKKYCKLPWSWYSGTYRSTLCLHH